MVPNRVLIVSDSQGLASDLRGIISQVAPERGVQVALSAEEGLKTAEAEDFEVVLAHFAEGPAKATDFLNEIWKQRPATVRFFFAETVSADLMVSSALGAHHFLPAPFTAATISGALARADAMQRFTRDERIQALVSRMRTLPSRPSLYVDVMRELRSPSASPESVAEILSKDLAISTKLIQLVNSAFYALQQQVTDPAAAVLLLGFETTASLVLSIEAMARFDKVKPLYFSMDRVWKHSQSVAQSAKRIAELASNDPEVARDAYTAGLLHDIGKLALALNFEEQYNGALKLAETQKIPACDVEKQVFGATHAEAGAYLLCLWGLPLPIVEAVADHHLSARELKPPFTAATALHLAERLHAELDHADERKPASTDLNYAPEFGLAPLIPSFRGIIAGGDSPGAAPAKGSPKPALKATAVPIVPGAAPAPMLTVSGPAGITKKSQLYLVGAALLALVCFGGFMALRGTNTPPPLNVQKQRENPQASLAKAVTPVPPAPVPEPAAPAPSPLQEIASRLKLQAIIYQGAKSSLVINGKNFHLGDQVEGARIVSIEQQAVTIEKGAEQFLLSLKAP